MMRCTSSAKWEKHVQRLILLILFLPLLFPACGQEKETAQPSLLREKDREFVRTTLADMKGTARLVLFTSREDCDYCDITESFLEDIASLASGVTVEVLSLEDDGSRAGELGIDKAPGIALLGGRDHGIRYYGLPTGYEFNTFVETIGRAADDDSGLMPETAAALASLSKPVTITVFSTKT
jgi:alkyl hydroperoxide reductase subunit AhpF